MAQDIASLLYILEDIGEDLLDLSQNLLDLVALEKAANDVPTKEGVA